MSLAAGALLWLAWLSWGFDDDHTYSTGQVLGCGVCAVLGVAALTVWFRSVPTPVVPLSTAFGLTVAWTIWAARSDDSGMYLVGTIIMAVGCSVGLLVVAAVVRALTRQVARRRLTARH